MNLKVFIFFAFVAISQAGVISEKKGGTIYKTTKTTRVTKITHGHNGENTDVVDNNAKIHTDTFEEHDNDQILNEHKQNNLNINENEGYHVRVIKKITNNGGKRIETVTREIVNKDEYTNGHYDVNNKNQQSGSYGSQKIHFGQEPVSHNHLEVLEKANNLNLHPNKNGAYHIHVVETVTTNGGNTGKNGETVTRDIVSQDEHFNKNQQSGSYGSQKVHFDQVPVSHDHLDVLEKINHLNLHPNKNGAYHIHVVETVTTNGGNTGKTGETVTRDIVNQDEHFNKNQQSGSYGTQKVHFDQEPVSHDHLNVLEKINHLNLHPNKNGAYHTHAVETVTTNGGNTGKTGKTVTSDIVNQDEHFNKNQQSGSYGSPNVHFDQEPVSHGHLDVLEKTNHLNLHPNKNGAYHIRVVETVTTNGGNTGKTGETITRDIVNQDENFNKNQQSGSYGSQKVHFDQVPVSHDHLDVLEKINHLNIHPNKNGAYHTHVVETITTNGGNTGKTVETITRDIVNQDEHLNLNQQSGSYGSQKVHFDQVPVSHDHLDVLEKINHLNLHPNKNGAYHTHVVETVTTNGGNTGKTGETITRNIVNQDENFNKNQQSGSYGSQKVHFDQEPVSHNHLEILEKTNNLNHHLNKNNGYHIHVVETVTNNGGKKMETITREVINKNENFDQQSLHPEQQSLGYHMHISNSHSQKMNADDIQNGNPTFIQTTNYRKHQHFEDQSQQQQQLGDLTQQMEVDHKHHKIDDQSQQQQDVTQKLEKNSHVTNSHKHQKFDDESQQQEDLTQQQEANSGFSHGANSHKHKNIDDQSQQQQDLTQQQEVNSGFSHVTNSHKHKKIDDQSDEQQDLTQQQEVNSGFSRVVKHRKLQNFDDQSQQQQDLTQQQEVNSGHAHVVNSHKHQKFDDQSEQQQDLSQQQEGNSGFSRIVKHRKLQNFDDQSQQQQDLTQQQEVNSGHAHVVNSHKHQKFDDQSEQQQDLSQQQEVNSGFSRIVKHRKLQNVDDQSQQQDLTQQQEVNSGLAHVVNSHKNQKFDDQSEQQQDLTQQQEVNSGFSRVVKHRKLQNFDDQSQQQEDLTQKVEVDPEFSHGANIRIHKKIDDQSQQQQDLTQQQEVNSGLAHVVNSHKHQKFDDQSQQQEDLTQHLEG